MALSNKTKVIGVSQQTDLGGVSGTAVASIENVNGAT